MCAFLYLKIIRQKVDDKYLNIVTVYFYKLISNISFSGKEKRQQLFQQR